MIRSTTQGTKKLFTQVAKFSTYSKPTGSDNITGYSGKWLQLETISLENNQRYDIIQRTTGEQYYSGVNLLAIKTYSEGPKFILISNYRIPAQERVMEVPSGMCLVG